MKVRVFITDGSSIVLDLNTEQPENTVVGINSRGKRVWVPLASIRQVVEI